MSDVVDNSSVLPLVAAAAVAVAVVLLARKFLSQPKPTEKKQEKEQVKESPAMATGTPDFLPYRCR